MKTSDGQTKTTVYTYDADNQLETAQENGGMVWQYHYDGNGNLVEMTPGSQAGNGAKHYTYNSAGQLTQVEAHDGTAYQVQAEMIYNGQGQRLSLTAYQDGQSLTTTYLLDGAPASAGGTLLAATANGATTDYLPGVGEHKQDWIYYLTDGTNSVRQMTGPQGEVTLTRSFTPWGELLKLTGEGDFTWGYLGGVLDAATGLIYVGNGQYYDPATGRFLSRGIYPGATNPYIPWQANPAGMIIAPLALLALIRGKRKAGKIDQVLVIAIVVMAVGISVSGCVLPWMTPAIQTPTPTAQQGTPSTPSTAAANQDPQATQTSTPTSTPAATATQAPTQNTPVPITCPPPEPTLTPTPTLKYDVLDRQELSRAPRGEKFYDLYLAMVALPQTGKWWYQDYGGEDGFTIWEFMSIMWTYDARLDLPIVIQAMHNRAKAFCPYGCNPTTSEGSLIFMSVFAQSAFNRVDKWQKGMDPDAPGVMDNSISGISAGQHIVEAIKTSDVDVNTLGAMDPLNYGNISLSHIYERMVSKGFVLKTVPASNGNDFFVLSKCQDYFAEYAKTKWTTSDTVDDTEFNKDYVEYCGNTTGE